VPPAFKVKRSQAEHAVRLAAALASVKFIRRETLEPMEPIVSRAVHEGEFIEWRAGKEQ
jgi:hypothetical protein